MSIRDESGRTIGLLLGAAGLAALAAAVYFATGR